ncbi:fumarate/nitrate reduction transcriptional regulator Fnr [Oxalobacteraceae bacterium OM1]|nr:fumarate/nitrate reduction transcriptional regulator Fnr [Oxalobacteraceae bacterium OM1]
MQTISIVPAKATEAAANSCAGERQDRQVKCSSCSLHQLCLPTGLGDADTQQLDSIIVRRRKVQRDGNLFHMGDRFSNLYAIRLGHFKTHQVSADGAEQITGFQMAGELLGMDAISADRHNSYAVALEDSEVCEIPFSKLEELFGAMPTLLRHFHRMMSQEITRDQSAMLLLGNMRAEQRFAAFLVNLSSRYKVRGYSSLGFQLRMSREDIGNYLGLTIESISRLLSRFKKRGLLKVSNREIELLDLPALKEMALGTAVTTAQ